MPLMFPKPRVRLLEKRQRAADLDKIDRAESAKVRKRSGGRCEVRTWPAGVPLMGRQMPARCHRTAAPGNHHLRGGSGVRNRGTSILSEHRIDACQKCHDDITGHVLVPLGTVAQRERAETVTYRRVT